MYLSIFESNRCIQIKIAVNIGDLHHL